MSRRSRGEQARGSIHWRLAEVCEAKGLSKRALGAAPEMIESEAKWSGQDRSVFEAISGPTYPGVGKINPDSIRHQQDLWLSIG